MADPRTHDAVVLVPGIMGSELVDATGRVVWGLKPSLLFRQLVGRDILARLKLPPGAPDDGIRPSRLLAVPGYLPMLDGMAPYTDIERALRKVAVHPEAVVTFPYDWRRSVAHNARLLDTAARTHLAAWRERYRSLPEFDAGRDEPRLTLVCHSMGGLLARHFTEVLEGRDVTRTLITLGTPFAGSVKAARLISRGDVFLSERLAPALADAVRDAARTFPGVYDLLPRYPCVRTGQLSKLSPEATVELGGEPALVAQAASSYEALIAAAKAAGRAACPIRPVVGITQPTLASLSIVDGAPLFDERLDGEEVRGGDSTVPRDAGVPSFSTPAYLPQKHGKLAQSAEGVAHAVAVLTEREPGAFQGDGLGLRLPDAVRAGQPFEVDVEPLGMGSTLRLFDADTDRQVDQKTPIRRGDRSVATFTVASPGLYRMSAAGGGFSPVEELLLALE